MAVINLANINSNGGGASSAKERDFTYTFNGDYTVKSKSYNVISKANIAVNVSAYVYSDIDGMKYRSSNITKFPDNWRFAPRTGNNCNVMFYNCSSLTSLDLSSFDTSKVTDMNGMFWGCSLLTSLDLRSFNTSNVMSMSYMFSGCSSLTSLDLSSFDTSKVTSISNMFYNCRSLKSIDLSSFDTSKVTDMYYMFYDCSSLTSLNLSSFDTSNVTKNSFMIGAFAFCTALTDLILGEGFGKAAIATTADFSSLTNWTNDTVKTSLLSLYDRVANGLTTKMTLKLSSNTKAVLSDEDISTLTARGYIITT